METSIQQASGGTPRGGKSRDEMIADDAEVVRIALLSCTNGSNDPLLVNGIARINAYAQEVVNDPQSVVGNSLARMSVAQLQSIGSIANMGNTPATIVAFSKQCFAADHAALSSKVSELGYLKAAQVAAGNYAMTGEYHSGTKVDMPKFRDDVQKALTQNAGNLGYQHGAAAAAKAAAKAAAAAPR